MSMKELGGRPVLVTGGAGYIGSHAVLALQDAGCRVVVLDNLSTGVQANLSPKAKFVEGDVADASLVSQVLGDHDVGAVMHFAASLIVPESVSQPLAYYRNNVAGSLCLIEACVGHGVAGFVFSSTAAVYGAPETNPVSEAAPVAPINPYGASKLMVERILRDTQTAHGLKVGILRYFNVAGADPDGRTGQSTQQATHLIKVAAETALGKRALIEIFGDDYPTADGTGVRDYIHVSDLVDAHICLLGRMLGGGEGGIYNCGYGTGFSVKQVIAAVEHVTGEPLPVKIAPRRAGDPPEIVADSTRFREEFAWKPNYDDLGLIVETALAWEKRL